MKIIFLFCSLAFVSFCRTAPLEEPIEQDPELFAEYFEDEILDFARNGIRNETLRWPNNIVNYCIDNEFDENHRKTILQAIHNIENVSCIRFKEVTTDQDYYIYINKNSTECSSAVGFMKRVQKLNLGINCVHIGIIMHELFHALGFYHMQSAANRDDYVRILYENIAENKENNFQKYNATKVNDFGEEYDYASIMHYKPDAFSKNGKNTIEPLKDKEYAKSVMGKLKLSDRDIRKLNKMYRCNAL